MQSLSKKQREIIHYNNENDPLITILEGAVRSGKTYLSNFLWVHHVGKHKDEGLNFIITGNTIGAIERNVLSTLTEMFGFSIRMDQFNRFKLFGNTVHCFGADNEAAYRPMTGFTAHGWYANEVTLQHPNSIQTAFQRCSGEGFRIFWDTNPDYPEHPIKVDHIDHSGDLLSNGRMRLKSWHFEIGDNPFLSAEYVENLKRTTPKGMWYDRGIKGLWVAAEGLVYELYDRDTHVREFEVGTDWIRSRGIDWGFNNPFVCLWGALDHDGRLYIYDEYYADHTLIKDHAARIKRIEGVFQFTVADHDAQDNAEIGQHGIHTNNAQKDVSIGIQKVAERLVIQADGKPKLFIHSKCENLRREMGKYAWQKQKADRPAKEEPVKADDHALDALRYMVMEIDNSRIPDVARAWA